MIQKDNRDKVLKVFYDNPSPSEGYQLREISRITGLGLPSVTRYLNELVKEQIVLKKPDRVQKYPRYWANRDSEEFKILKKQNIVDLLHETSLVQKLEESCAPLVIILFGSAVRGEDINSSDIDIYVQAKEKQLNFTSYEKKINRRINLFYEENFKKLSPELKNNIINGIVLSGYLEVF